MAEQKERPQKRSCPVSEGDSACQVCKFMEVKMLPPKKSVGISRSQRRSAANAVLSLAEWIGKPSHLPDAPNLQSMVSFSHLQVGLALRLPATSQGRKRRGRGEWARRVRLHGLTDWFKEGESPSLSTGSPTLVARLRGAQPGCFRQHGA